MNNKDLKKQFENELTDNILNYWVKEVYDSNRRLFYGRISLEGKKFPDAPLSAVLVTRIMWTFSAAYQFYPTAIYQKMAEEAFRILRDSFWDKENGGIYWSISPDGKPIDNKKQFYAEAFFIYALSEYHRIFKNKISKQLALSMFDLMEKYAFDQKFDGYFEATTADWKPSVDQRLSPDQQNIKKTMNTHLHILEAYTNLYRVWQHKKLRIRLEGLIRIFLDKIINPKTFHFHLFFDSDWTVRSHIDSYGHDIEGSWLLYEAAEVLGNEKLIEEVKIVALKMVKVTQKEGLSKNGGLYYEKEGEHLNDNYSWWPQAETVIGFFNAWQLSQNDSYFNQSVKSWEFIQKYIVDHEKGEWFLGVSASLKTLPNDKVSGWKAPYHNGRMCMEMIRRMEKINE